MDAYSPMVRFRPIHLVFVVAVVFASVAQGQQTQYEFRDGRFVKIGEPDPATPSGELAEVRRAIADGKAGRAIKLANAWIDSHERHPDLPQAYLLRADAKVLKGDYFQSLFDYEYLVRMYPGSPEFHIALEREYEVAKIFANGKYRKLWGLRIVPAYGEAEELFIRIQERSPGSSLAELSGKELGDLYYRRGEMYLAAEAYDIFVDNYPRSQWSEYGMQRQITANLATFKGPRFDATGLLEAEVRLNDFKDRHPAAAEQAGADELLVRVDESLAEKQLETAEWYDGQDMRVSAVYMYGRVVSDHPRSAAAVRAMKRLKQIDPQRAAQLEAGRGERSSRSPAEALDPTRAPATEPVETTEPIETEAPIMDRPDMVDPEIRR
jgi:outer membrane protein assembly factor BamD (BamD/ComL family)